MKKIISAIYHIAFPVAKKAMPGEETATYEGIKKKMFMFSLTSLASMILYLLLSMYLIYKFPNQVENIDLGTGDFDISVWEGMIVVLAALMVYARLIRSKARITGFIYSVSRALVMTFILRFVYTQPLLKVLQFLLPALILSIMPFIFMRGIDFSKYPHFRDVIVVFYILYLIWKPLTGSLDILWMKNSFFGSSIPWQLKEAWGAFRYVLFMIMSEGFLLLAVQRCKDYIKRGVEKRYEWLAAFVLYFTLLETLYHMLMFILDNVQLITMS